MSKETVATAKTLVEKIAAFLKLDDAGRVEKFIASNVKDYKRSIKELEAISKAKALQYETASERLTEKLEDAQTASDDSYLAVDITKLSSNAEMNEYRETYRRNIEKAAGVVARVEDEIKQLKEEFEADNKENVSQIAAYNSHIAKMS